MKWMLGNDMNFSEWPQRGWLFQWMKWILVNEMYFSEWNERNEFSIDFKHFQWMKSMNEWMNEWMNEMNFSEWNEF